MKYTYNKGLILKKREWLLIIFLIAVLTMFGLILTNNKLGVDFVQACVGGLK